MGLTVEDGTGIADADAFVSLAALKAYLDARGTSYAAYADAALEQAIVRATDYLSESFTWKGYRVKSRSHTTPQALAWPRYNVTDGAGYSVSSSAVPTEIERATYEVAIAEAASPGTMQPTYTPQDRVKSEKIGPIEVEYAVSDTSAQSARPVLLAVRDLIGGLLSETGGSMIAGESYRA